MQEVVQKIKDKITEIGNIKFASYTKPLIAVEDVLNIIDVIAEEYRDGWILCSERLPEDPEIEDEDGMEELIYEGKISEYIVTVCDADEATSLYYAGNGLWYDKYTGDFYKVIAWQPFPEGYKEKQNER